MAVRVLLVEDDQNYLYEVKEEVAASNADLAEFHTATTLREAIRKVDEIEPDLVLADIIFPVDERDARADRLDYEAGVKLIRHAVDRGLATQFIVLSSQSKTLAVNLLIEYKAVRDYIFKDASWPEINAKVRRHIESLSRLPTAATMARRHLIVGDSAPVRRVRELIERVARRDDTTVLVSGESGTGKELVAQTIHALSARRDRPFVVVNCAAIPETLLESELFGYLPGAFTGAVRESRGRFELAHTGTLFLDEIAEVPPGIQVKLLRAIQEKTVERLGGSSPTPIDVRFIAATNRDLGSEMKAGRFRDDLFYRLNVFPIHVPPLRERREDIPLLVRFHLAMFNKEMENSKAIDEEAIDLLARADWPGNIRELRNVVERLIIISDAPTITADDVAALLRVPETGYAVTFPPGEADYKKAKAEVLALFNRRFLEYHLRRNDYNILRTAQVIGYNREDLSSRVKKLGIDLKRRS